MDESGNFTVTTHQVYNITLVGTIHSATGRANVDELCKILEDINPDVIFDELPANVFDRYYGDSFDRYYVESLMLNRHAPEIPLEVKCIRKYTQNQNIEIVPVDIDVSQKLSKYQDEIVFLFNTIFANVDHKNLISEHENLIKQEGSVYLNSHKFLHFLEEKKNVEDYIIESNIEKDRLRNMYKLFHAEQTDGRENAMLENIYNYSKENRYNHAVFLIGAEHKKSITQKLIE